MACGGCTRRKLKIKEIWHKHGKPKSPPGEVVNTRPLRASGGIGRTMSLSGSMKNVKILTVQSK
jgi:hypothetical protein